MKVYLQGVISLNKIFKALKTLLVVLLLGTSFLPVFTIHAADAKYDPASDPQNGTANEEIESVIQAGKDLLGKVPYNFGGGHLNSYADLKKYNTSNGLDCSAFIAYIFMEGMGLGAPSIFTTTSLRDSTPSEFVKKIPQSEWKRGDIILLNNNTHTVLYLGKNDAGKDMYIGADTTPGVTLKEWTTSWMKYDGLVVRIPDRETALASGYFTDLGYDGPTASKEPKNLADPNVVFEGSDAWKNPMVNFKTMEYVANPKGVTKNKGELVNSNLVVAFTNGANTLLDWSYVAVMYTSLAYMTYMVVVLITYLAVLPRGNMKVHDYFEKATNYSSARSNETLLDMLSKMLLGVFVVACLYANVHTYIFSGIYSLLSLFI